MMSDRFMQEEPPLSVTGSMTKADLYIEVTKFSLFQTNARREAVNHSRIMDDSVDSNAELVI